MPGLNVTPRASSVAAAVAVAINAPAVQAQSVIEEIVVTATKREESMQDVPVAVSALRGDDLEELRIGSFQDYVMFLPNVVSQGTGPGQNEIFIRGAATSQTIITLSSVQGLQPSVALYQDEQPVALQGRNLDVYVTDLARVEVLPGPQGTLFGASSQAGTVRLITNKPNHDEFQAGFDASISGTSGGDNSHSLEAYVNIPFSDSFAARVAAYNDVQGGWIDNVLNDPDNGGWNGSIDVIDRISGSPGIGATEFPVPRNDALVENNFNDASYAGARFGLSWLVNDEWDVLVQHTQQSLATEGVWAYDPNLAGDSSVNRFAPDENNDDFGLTTWTISGRLAMLDVIYTGGYLNRDVSSTIDYTFYTNGGLFSAYYVCYPGDGTYNQCYDPSKFYKEDTDNTRTTHEFRLSTPTDNRWRITGGLFYDDQELASTGLFKIASTASPAFSDLQRFLVAPGQEGTRTDGGPFPAEISFVNDVTRTTEQVAVFGQVEFDVTDNLTAAIGARWYDIDDEYKGSTTTVDVTSQLRALGTGTQDALIDHFGPVEGAAIFDAIQNGELDVSELNGNGVLNQSDTILRASLDWRLNDQVLVFGTYAQGFRPPVTNRVGASLANAAGSNPTFADFRVPVSSATDDLDNYEIGIKSDLLDNTLRLNATAYWSEISNMQLSRFDPTNISFLWFADNVGDAEIAGIDGDFIWLPTERLQISGAFSILDTEITRLNEELQGIAAPVGSQLPYTAEFSANLRARYDFDIPRIGNMSGLMGYVTGGIAYTGESLAGLKMDAYVVEDTMQRVYQVSGSGLKIQREADAFLGAAPGTDLINEPAVPGGRYVQEAYTIANFAFGVSRESWAAELFIDNAFDESAIMYIDTQQFTPHVVTNRPRTIGLRISYDYL
jgi:outer membrane receptor protein involved in Fe transport